MLKYPEATPCPVLVPFTASIYEPTEELNFTTDIQAALRQAGPRRRKLFLPQERSNHYSSQLITAGKIAGMAMLETQCHHERSESVAMADRLQKIGAGNRTGIRRPSFLLSDEQGTSKNLTTIPCRDEGADPQDMTHMHKKPRRRTIYVPSDDTSILTIHPGQLDARSRIDYSVGAATIEGIRSDLAPGGNGQGQRSRANKKPLAAAPKRAPLQPALKSLQETEDQSDIAGNGPGKENLRPCTMNVPGEKGHKIMGSRARRISIFGSVVERGVIKPEKLPVLSPDKRSKTKLDSSAGRQKAGGRSLTKPMTRRDPRQHMMNRRNSLYYGSTRKSPIKIRHEESLARLPSKVMAPKADNEATMRHRRYSILREGIDRPEMFEDTWLDDQECAIQQLINGLFDVVSPVRTSGFPGDIDNRKHLLQLYQGPECSLLYKRIQASLCYGSLSPPESSIADSSRLKSDIGLRQKLLSTWMGTYDLELLQAAVEVVIGREIHTISSLPADGSQAQPAKKSRRRDLEQFITACLLHNEDAAESDQSSPLWCWRRTVLRSLMLVYLLDLRAKETKVLSKNLFQTSSRLKSSRSVVTEIAALLIPSIGDVYRPLSYLEYHVGYTQSPLSEYRYNITNLATDLRDGVRLTRLVELLLWPPQSLGHLDNSITVTMPTGEVLMSTIGDGEFWVLSQHLRFPYISRAQKLFNVQIALSALQSIRGVQKMAEALRAEDIVDGHREKTVTLLWALVGKWGFDYLVDFSELGKEVLRLQRTTNLIGSKDSEVDEEEESNPEGLEDQKKLLRSWAQTIARQHGLQVLNLTTSFSDGKVFAMIIDEYQGFLSCPQISRNCLPAERSTRLDLRLKEIGCSASFGKQRVSPFSSRFRLLTIDSVDL